MSGDPLRILLVSNFMPPHPGGLETMVQLLHRGLRERGHDARWLASAEPAAVGVEGSLVRVPAWNPLERRVHVPMPVWGPPALSTLLAEVQRAQVVHLHDCIYLSSWSGLLAARLRGRPVLLTQHVGFVPYGNAFDAVQVAAHRTVGRLVLDAVDARVAISLHVPPWFRAQGVRRPFETIPNGRDERRFHPLDPELRRRHRARLGLEGASRVVLFAARLVPKKGVDVLTRAWPALIRAHPGWRLVVAGEGPLYAALAALPGVRMLGQVAHEEMPAIYGMADVFWLPSRGEGFPLTVQEALLCGTPAVVSDDPSFVENVPDVDGVQICRDDGQAGRALARVRSDEERQAIATWAAARWGLAPMLDGYLRIYRRLLAGR